MVGCGSKNIYKKGIYSKNIGLHAHNKITILSSIVNLIGGRKEEHRAEAPMIEHLRDFAPCVKKYKALQNFPT